MLAALGAASTFEVCVAYAPTMGRALAVQLNTTIQTRTTKREMTEHTKLHCKTDGFILTETYYKNITNDANTNNTKDDNTPYAHTTKTIHNRQKHGIRP